MVKVHSDVAAAVYSNALTSSTKEEKTTTSAFTRAGGEASASCPSRWFLCWLWPLVRRRKAISSADVSHLVSPKSSGSAKANAISSGADFNCALMMRMFKWQLLSAALARLLSDLLFGLAPILLGALIEFVERKHDQQQSEREGISVFGLHTSVTVYGCGLAVALFAVLFVRSLFQNQHILWMARIGIQLQTMLTTALYSTALSLPLLPEQSLKSKGISAALQWSGGNILNTMSTDVDRLTDFAVHLHAVWSMPLQVIICALLLYQYIGLGAVCALLIFLAMFPLNGFVLRCNGALQKAQQLAKSKRVQMLKEIIAGITSLKLYGWERPLATAVERIRIGELKQIRKSNLFRMLTETYQAWSLHLALLFTYLLFRLLNPSANLLTPKIAFVTYTLVGLVRPPLFQFAQVMQKLAQVLESYKRIRRVLQNDVKSSNGDAGTKTNVEMAKCGQVECADLAVCCNPPSRAPNANGDEQQQQPQQQSNGVVNANGLRIKRGHLVAVVGQHNSGKSALLLTLLGECNNSTGGAHSSAGAPVLLRSNNEAAAAKPRVAYCAQSAFIVQGTVRENVLLGGASAAGPVDEGRLAAAMRVCQLDADKGLHLERVTKRGLDLSGGQKARLALARAVYADADLYLLDDVLAPLDVAVCRAVFDAALGPQSLLAAKTRILCTQNVGLISQCDWVVEMKDKAVHFQGTPAEYFHAKDISIGANGAAMGNGSDTSAPSRPEEAPILAMERGQNEEKAKPANRKAVVWKLYARYLAKWSALWATGFIGMLLFNNVVSFGLTYLLAEWTSWVVEHPEQSRGHVEWSLFAIFTGLVLVGVFTTALCCFCQLMGAQCASLRLHQRAVLQMMQAPLVYFSTVPAGKMLNHLSDDFAQIDNEMSHSLRLFLNAALLLAQILVTIAVSTSPLFLALIVLPMLLYLYILRTFIRVSTQLKRMERQSRAPLFASFEEVMDGRVTFRAYAAQQHFTTAHDAKLRTHLDCKYLQLASQRWLSTWLELIGNLTVLLVALMTVASSTGLVHIVGQGAVIMPGFVGLSRSMGLSMVLALLVQQFSQLEAGMVSAEAVYEFLNETAPKKKSGTLSIATNGQLPSQWQDRGDIQFEHYSTSYHEQLRSGANALNDVNVHIRSTQKVAIIGRTGSGKSSMVLALFRLLEAKNGRICIDGVDIAKMDAHKLRSCLTIVPQSPLIFSESVRFNLDPSGQLDDAQLWSSLERAGLSQFFRAKDRGLELQLADAGVGAMSAGQCQLFLLARALLKGASRVVVMDELDAPMDAQTEHFVHQTIQREFGGATLLAVTHRSENLGAFDRVLELSDGKLREVARGNEQLELDETSVEK